MKISMLLAAALAVAASGAHAAPTRPTANWKAQLRRAPTCDKVSDWYKNAYAYLKNGKVSAGKVPAIYATVTMVSIEPLDKPGAQKPDRLRVMYAFGEVTDAGLPVYVTLEGKLPLWTNNGDDKAPFGGGGKSTLNVVLVENGQQSFNWQIDGRNRLGKGPQSFALNAQTAQMTPDFLLYQGALNFHGFKNITLALVRGEKDAPAKKVVGARYRVSPSFLITNSSDGLLDNTVEVLPEIHFAQNGKEVGNIVKYQEGLGKGARMTGAPFDVAVLDADANSKNLRVSGKVGEMDKLTAYQVMWKADMNINVPFYAKSAKKGIDIPPALAFVDDEAQGTLELKIEKIADIY